jgi:hypothetical protein
MNVGVVVVTVLGLVVVVFAVVAALVVDGVIDEVCVGGPHGPQSPQNELWSTSESEVAALRTSRAAK